MWLVSLIGIAPSIPVTGLLGVGTVARQVGDEVIPRVPDPLARNSRGGDFAAEAGVAKLVRLHGEQGRSLAFGKRHLPRQRRLDLLEAIHRSLDDGLDERRQPGR